MSRLISFEQLNRLLLVMILIFSLSLQAKAGISVKVKTDGGDVEKVELYGGSHALLVGVSNYSAGWPSLESIHGEMNGVESLLKKKGFQVERVNDPDSRQLGEAFKSFINRHGYEPNNRLLFFYAGHGYTRKKGKKGYLVPADAPDPEKDEKGFLSKALGMNHILSWARDIEAKHVLFLFDSCFSGTIFKLRDRPKPPKHITRMTALPVRQFITAGQAGESVPANSTFTPMFIDAIKYGIADLNGDSYVSGTELGMFLQEKVPLHVEQSPQFGKIQDYELSRGDFIFLSGIPKIAQKAEADNVPAASQQREITEPIAGIELVWVDGGCFKMGQTAQEGEKIVKQRGSGKYRQFFDNERESIVKNWSVEKYILHFKDERPEHEVCIDGFWMGKYEVTQGQWQKIMGSNPARFKSGDTYPVEQVSWGEVQDFLRRLNTKNGTAFRLPTEAEWEFAARGNLFELSFAGGDNADGVAWHGGNSEKKTHRVGSKKPNAFGLYDMSGNVWEWCGDWYYGGYYAVSPRNNPQGPPSGEDRVIRGGSWDDGPFYLRVTCRNYTPPGSRDSYLGFRLAAPGE